jgi:putative flippase GtrA
MIKNNFQGMILASVSSQKFRYLLAGAWNTLFGYLCGVSIYYIFGSELGIFIVAILSNILAISMSFLTHKLFVFKTKGNWIIEYMRAYCVYGLLAIVGIILLIIFVRWLEIQFWLAQGLVVFLSVVVSYLGHKKFTFKL